MTHAETFVVAVLAGLVAGAAAFGLNLAVNAWMQQAQQDAAAFGGRFQ